MQDGNLKKTTDIVVAAIEEITKIWTGLHSSQVVEKLPIKPTPTREKQIVYCYLIGCGGLSVAARQNNGRARYKIGTTSYTNLNDRLAEIGRDRYAAAVKVGNVFQIESGYEAWTSLMIRTSRAPRDARITLLPRAIKIQLPADITRRSFDEALHRKLMSRSVNLLGAEPQRFTVTYEGEAQVIRKAREVYVFSPLKDGDELLRAVEEILQKTTKQAYRKRRREA